MKNYIKELKAEFIRLHGDSKWSIEHDFIAVERERVDGNVIVGYSYKYFGDAKTTISQYSIPEKEWDDSEKFITFKDKVSPCKDFPNGCFCEISYNVSINAFYSSLTIDMLSSKAEREHRKNPPYIICDKEPDIDIFDGYDELYYFSDDY